MKGFHVSASGAIQGHHGPLVLSSRGFICYFEAWPKHSELPKLPRNRAIAIVIMGDSSKLQNKTCLTALEARGPTRLSGRLFDL